MAAKSIITLLSLTFLGSGICHGKWMLGTETYQADTLYHAVVGPGVTQTSIALTGPTKQRIFYAEVDLTNPYITIKTPKGQNRLGGSMTLSDYASTLTNDHERYIIGSNADFGVSTAIGLIPCGPSVSEGTPYYSFNQGWYGMSINEDKVPMIDKFIFEGSATSHTGAPIAISGINTPPLNGQPTIFTAGYGPGMTLEEGLTVCKLTNLNGELAYNGKSKWCVESLSTNTSQPLDDSCILLCGKGSGATALSELAEGEDVILDLNPSLADYGRVVEMTGGCPAILKDGKILDTGNVLDHLTADNPRTSVGYNADRTRMVMMVVDGRSGTARGMTSTMLAQLMLAAGCSDALNLDGGGSSELYSLDRGILNNPSDGAQRKVTNSLWAVAIAPDDDAVANVATEQWRVELPQYALYTPVFYAYNKYGVLVDLNYKDYTLSAAEDWCTPTSDRQSIVATAAGHHVLKVNYGGDDALTCDVEVDVVESNPTLRFTSIVIDDISAWPVEVVSTIGDATYILANSTFQWSSSDTSIASVDSNGAICGIADGTATVTATSGEVCLQLTVNVQIPTARYKALSIIPSEWQASGSNIAGIALSESNGALKIDFTQSSARARSLMLKPVSDMKLWSMPDSLEIVMGDDAIHLTGVDVKVSNPYERAVTLSSNSDPGAECLRFSLNPAVSFGQPSYPLTLESITLKLPSESRRWSVGIESISTCYDRFAVDGVEDINVDGGNEPTFLSECITLPTGTLRWTIADLNGRAVLAGNTLTVNLSLLPRGCYILCIGVGKAYKFMR